MMNHENFFKSPIVLRRIVGFLILDILLRGDYHGYDLWKKLEEILGTKIPHPIVYKILKEFEEMGLVVGRWVSAKSGPARKIYSITIDGVMILKHNLELFRKIRDLLSTIIEHVESVDLNSFSKSRS